LLLLLLLLLLVVHARAKGPGSGRLALRRPVLLVHGDGFGAAQNQGLAQVRGLREAPKGLDGDEAGRLKGEDGQPISVLEARVANKRQVGHLPRQEE
jgi:hypothetical protein